MPFEAVREPLGGGAQLMAWFFGERAFKFRACYNPFLLCFLVCGGEGKCPQTAVAAASNHLAVKTFLLPVDCTLELFTKISLLILSYLLIRYFVIVIRRATDPENLCQEVRFLAVAATMKILTMLGLLLLLFLFSFVRQGVSV